MKKKRKKAVSSRPFLSGARTHAAPLSLSTCLSSFSASFFFYHFLFSSNNSIHAVCSYKYTTLLVRCCSGHPIDDGIILLRDLPPFRPNR